MPFTNQNQIDQLNKEIADLRKAEAQETRKEADLRGKINRASEYANRTKNLSTFQSKMRDVERHNKSLADVQRKRADILKKIADKSKKLEVCNRSKIHQEEIERTKSQVNWFVRKPNIYGNNVISEIQSGVSPMPASGIDNQEKRYDFFISHASEDKENFVRSLVEQLQAKKIDVWYDEFTLKVGDSLKQSIEEGLIDSRYGIVVLSRNFFEKEWPKIELNTLVQLASMGESRILPIWYNITKDEISKFSPMLLDVVALDTFSKTTEEIVDELCQLIGSTE